MLNLIPRYLPRYGMSPEWAGAVRPLVLVLTGTAFLITWIFDADVDAQGGAYATGVLVLMTSAAVAVTLAARKAGQRRLTVAFSLIGLVLAYTTLDNVRERPDGVKIGACFIAAIVLVSLLSRAGARLRAPHHRDRVRRARRVLPARLRPPLDQAGRQRARRPRRRGVPREDPPDRRRPRPAQRRRHHLRRGHRRRLLRLREPHRGPRRGAARPVPGAHRHRRLGAQHPGLAAARHPRPHRRPPPHLLRVDRGQPGRQPAPVPALRRRRGRPRHPRGAPPRRARPEPAALTSTPAEPEGGQIRESRGTTCVPRSRTNPTGSAAASPSGKT